MTLKVNKGNNKRLKSRLKKSSICHYCGIEVIKSKRGCQSDNGATIDHIYSRCDIIRMLIDNKYPTLRHKHTVLSCYKCNQERNELQQRNIIESYESLKRFDILDIRLLDFC